MKAISMHLSELSESREVMESKPYPMVMYFAYILMVIISVALVWMYFGEMDIVLKGHGIIRPSSDISVVTNKVTGRVAKDYLTEGKRVESGDVLYTIAHDELSASEALVTNEIAVNETELKNLEKYKASILAGNNLFDLNIDAETAYYYLYQGYAQDHTISKKTVSKLQQDVAGLKMELESIRVSKSVFASPNDQYALQYQAFQLKMKGLGDALSEKDKQLMDIRELYDRGAASKSDVDQAQTAYDKALLDQKQYLSATLTQLKTDLATAELDLTKNTAMTESKITSEGDGLPVKTQAIIKVDEQIKQTLEKLRSYEEKQKETKVAIENCIVRAETTGVVNVKQKITPGDYIQTGTLIATVIPSDRSTYRVEISMPEKDIAGMKVGDVIKYHFDSLPYQEYGTLKGVVTKISSDSTVDEKLGVNYYAVEAVVENQPVYSYKGKQARLKVGMTCEAQVITKSKRILSILMEKLDLWS